MNKLVAAQSHRRLVEKNERRIADRGPGQVDEFVLAERKLAHRRSARLRGRNLSSCANATAARCASSSCGAIWSSRTMTLASAVRSGTSRATWKERPIKGARSSMASRVISRAAQDAPSRCLALSMPEIMLKSVDLPAPFGPTMAKISPNATSKLIVVERLDAAEALRHAGDRQGNAASLDASALPGVAQAVPRRCAGRRLRSGRAARQLLPEPGDPAGQSLARA